MYYINGVLVYEEYAFTTCSGDECQTTRTIDSSTPFKINCGGSGGGTYNGEVIENVSASDGETQYTDVDGINTGGNVGIGYTYTAAIARISSTREITSVAVDPITANPMFANYIDNYGRSVTRSLTLFGHNNTYTLLSATSVMVNWSCFVYARYIYTDGSPEFPRQWSKSKSSVYY
jgi:hypothetical protein